MIEYARRMKMPLTFTLLMISGALSFTVMGYTGGAVTITCPYDRGYTSNEKYFCKGQKPVIPRPGWCFDVIKTDIKDKRFSLYDDTTASVFNVTITDLNEHDSDTYYCVVDIVGWTDIYTEVKLNVREVTFVVQMSSSPPSSPSSSPSFPTLETSMFTEIQQTKQTTGFFVMIISEVLFLLLVRVPLLLLAIRQTHGSDLSLINTVEFNACDKADLHSDANTDSRTTVVYSLHLPINPPE
ncbi:CMRF35-like molecule 3 [Triplophysa rosa]|uniref:CMRF35-like molecule 3 n=1 Tax=Triplophysa rosa TaxID=992332 RepID=UPI002545EDAA|nr:CMRF35-like molecule 3 [Triplophysa rosa]XP_057188565.1 CMRF35-like molecule 3 [Triplophysa rosa]